MRKLGMFALAALLAVGVLAVGVEGQEKKQAPATGATLTVSFAAIDTNMDKKISKAEWDAYFAKLDKNSDEFLTEEEIQAAAREGKARSKDGQK